LVLIKTSNNIVGNMSISGVIAEYAIDPFTNNQQYYCIASNTAGTSGASNVVITNLGTSTC
jgi:hypothetical protein